MKECWSTEWRMSVCRLAQYSPNVCKVRAPHDSTFSLMVAHGLRNFYEVFSGNFLLYYQFFIKDRLFWPTFFCVAERFVKSTNFFADIFFAKHLFCQSSFWFTNFSSTQICFCVKILNQQFFWFDTFFSFQDSTFLMGLKNL